MIFYNWIIEIHVGGIVVKIDGDPRSCGLDVHEGKSGEAVKERQRNRHDKEPPGFVLCRKEQV